MGEIKCYALTMSLMDSLRMDPEDAKRMQGFLGMNADGVDVNMIFIDKRSCKQAIFELRKKHRSVKPKCRECFVDERYVNNQQPQNADPEMEEFIWLMKEEGRKEAIEEFKSDLVELDDLRRINKIIHEKCNKFELMYEDSLVVITSQKARHAEELKAKDKQILELTREVRGLEHRLKEMEERAMLMEE